MTETSELPKGLVTDGVHDIKEEARDAHTLHQAGTCKKVRLRLPALMTTLVLELGVAFVFASYTDTFAKYPLLIAFQPVISAVSGNVGLQASSTNVRALALGLFRPQQFVQGVLPEGKSAIVVGLFMGILIGIIAGIWAQVTPHENGGSASTTDAIVFGIAIWLGMMFSVAMAGFSGSIAPMWFKIMTFDPSTLAGPLETAFQDIIGGTVLLALSAWIMSTFGDDDQICPGGDLQGCIGLCTLNSTGLAAPASVLVNSDCMDNCINLAGLGVC